MRSVLFSIVIALIASLTAHAQLKTRTEVEPSLANDLPRRPLLNGGEPIARNMVWRADAQKREWAQVEVNSCEWCGRPMTWKQAAFDKKALPLWIAATALAVADTEYTMSRPCIRAGSCAEWNPLLGKTRAQQYGVRMPVLALAWFGTAWVRKGHSDANIGGMRHWYLFPASFIAMPSAGLVANSVRR